MKYQPTYNIPDIFVPFIRAVATLIDKTPELVTPHTLFNNLINYIGSGDGLKPADLSSYLDRLLERVKRAKEYLEKLLHDYSVIGRANLKAFYEYIIGLFEELKKMCPDWMAIPFAVAIALLIALIMSILLFQARGIVENRRVRAVENELQLLQWHNTQIMDQSIRSERAERLCRMMENLRLIDKRWDDGGRIPAGFLRGAAQRREIDISIEILKCQLIF